MRRTNEEWVCRAAFMASNVASQAKSHVSWGMVVFWRVVAALTGSWGRPRTTIIAGGFHVRAFTRRLSHPA